jgi:hypothetical protein
MALRMFAAYRPVLNAVVGPKLTAARTEVLLRIGNTEYTRARLAELTDGVGMTRSVHTVRRTLAALHMRTRGEITRVDPLSFCRIEKFGEGALWVLMCVLDDQDVDIAKWFGWDQNPRTVSWRTLRHQTSARAANMKKKRGGHRA